MSMEMALMFGLITKHFIVDFLLQTEIMWRNKGNVAHIGGYLHAGLHALASLLVFSLIIMLGLWTTSPSIAILLLVVVVEFMIHYQIDWCKVNYNKLKGWDANKHPQFWYLTGFDQYLHYLTYWLMILFLGIV